MIKRFGINITPNLYDEPPFDEIYLAQQARAINATLNNKGGHIDYVELSKRYSLDIATRCIYERVSDENQAFIQTLNRQKVDATGRGLPIPPDVKILLVPGLFYQQHPEVGVDGALIEEIATRLGIPLKRVPVDSLGSIETNTKIIQKSIESEGDNKLWFISISKGGSEVANCFQTCPQIANVKGWVNIAGVNTGSPHLPRKLGNSHRRIWYRLLSSTIGLDYTVLQELHPQHPLWQGRRWPSHIDIVHVTPMPLRSHVQPILRKRYEKISPLGPNDGFVLLQDTFAIPGKVYPLWGVDHFVRAPQISEIVYKLFAYIAAQSNDHNKENNNETFANSQCHPSNPLSFDSA